MANKIKTLVLDIEGDTILPRTVSDAVVMEDGTTLSYRSKNTPTDYIKVTETLAASLGLPAGTDLSTFLTTMINQTANTLAAAEITE